MSLYTHIRHWWSRHCVAVLRLAVAVMGVFALVKLGSEFYRLVFDQSWLGANDLKYRYEEVNRWFAHLPVYSESVTATYPPMSYAILWPALGWAPLDACRWLWAVASVGSLLWLIRLTVRESGASTMLERLFAALLPLAINATGIAIGNGQLIVFITPMLWTSILLLTRKGSSGWGADLVVAVLFLLGLVHPSTASPFFWIVLFARPRIRPAALIVVGYIALTLLASSFQPASLTALLQGWLDNTQTETPNRRYADVHLALLYLGLRDWALAISGVMIAVLGAWVYVYRRLEPWLLLGVTAVVARLWTYHGVYDDLLIIFPMVALFRIAKRSSPSNDGIKAAVLLGMAVVVMLMPVRLYLFWESPWPAIFTWTHSAVWLMVLGFLLVQTHRASVTR